MHSMRITLISIKTTKEAGQVIARAIAQAPRAGARMWIEVRFKPQNENIWDEAYDRVLQLLDLT